MSLLQDVVTWPGNIAADTVEILSHRRHLEKLGRPDPTRLVISTDWLAWQEAQQLGHRAMHFDALLAEWPRAMGDPADHHRKACEWVYDAKGEDMTLFRGISLGKQFVRNITLFSLHFGRAWYGLDRLLADVQPKRLVLRDLRLRLDLLDDAGKRLLVAEACKRHGAFFEDQLDAPLPGDPGFPERFEGVGAPLQPPFLRTLLRNFYSKTIETIFALRRSASDPKPVLMLLNWIVVRGLLNACPRQEATAALFAGSLPKNFRFLAEMWRRRVFPVHLPQTRLDGADRAELKRLADRLEAEWRQTSGNPVVEARRRFIRERIVASGWLDEQAREVKRHQALFRRHRFQRIVVGDATNVSCRMLADTARQAGIKVDEMLNGMFLTGQRYDARVGDTHGKPAIDRLLARGERDSRWLALTEARLPTVTVGYPALARSGTPNQPLKNFDHALILPIYADGDDTLATQAQVFAHLIETVVELKRFGCRHVRVKLHIGPPNLTYYEELMAANGLDVEVAKDNALASHLAWADFVVGPVNSGAFLESLAQGKPYYPFQPSPSLIASEMTQGIDVLRKPDDLIDRLKEKRVVDARSILEDFASYESIENPGGAFWGAMREAV